MWVGPSQLVRMLRSMAVEPEKGQALLEYAWILVLVSIAAIVILAVIGGDVLSLFTKALNEITKAL